MKGEPVTDDLDMVEGGLMLVYGSMAEALVAHNRPRPVHASLPRFEAPKPAATDVSSEFEEVASPAFR